MRQRFARLGSVVLAGLIGLSGCSKSEYDYRTWTEKLGDGKEGEAAVDKLQQLCHPGAIPALGKAWQDAGKPVRMLEVIIGLSRSLTPKEALDSHCTDFVKEGRTASWEVALPFLKQAILEVDKDNPRSVDSATKAAEAIGQSQLEGGMEALIEIANKPVEKKLYAAQIAAVRAIGKFEGNKQGASAALVKIVDKEGPPHPSTVKGKEQQRAADEKYGFYLGLTGSAINALGDLRVPSATPALILAMYRVPALFGQTRRALVAAGPTAKEEMRKILRHEHAAVNQLFKDKKLGEDCDKTDPTAPCLPNSAMDYYPAVVLGDFYDPATVPDLLKVLERPELPVFYHTDSTPDYTQYSAIFDSLRKIGSADAAKKVREMWDNKLNTPSAYLTRSMAASAYAFLVRDGSGATELAAIAADNTIKDAEGERLRQEAATAFARIAKTDKEIKTLKDQAAKYIAAADVARKTSAEKKPAADAADAKLKALKQQWDDKKAASIKMSKELSAKKAATDAEATAQTKQLQAIAAEVDKLEADYKALKKANKAITDPYRQAENEVKGYTSFARMFLSHIARIEVGIRCGDKLQCYADTLKLTVEQSEKNLAPYLAGFPGDKLADWTKDQKQAILEANIERGMLELGKRGQEASQFTDLLLDKAKAKERLIRQSILLALPKIAKIPCASCEAKLDEVIKSGTGDPALNELNTETTMMRNYFGWAGGKTPTPSTSAPAEKPAEAPAK